MTRLVNPGEIFIISEGEYSDYGIVAKMRALCLFDIQGVWDAWYKEESAKWNVRTVNPSVFVAYLTIKGMAEEFPVTEFHYDYYGDYYGLKEC